MPSQNPRWAAPSLARHKPILLALTAVALGCSIYYLRDNLWPSYHPPKGGLHRSNARRQRQHRRQHRRSRHRIRFEQVHVHAKYLHDRPWGSVPVSLEFLTDRVANEVDYGYHTFLSSARRIIETPLRRGMPDIEDIIRHVRDQTEAAKLRGELEESFLLFYFWRHLSPSPISEDQRAVIILELEMNGFHADTIETVLEQHQTDHLTEKIESWLQVQDRRAAYQNSRHAPPQNTVTDELSVTETDYVEAMTPSESENSWGRDELTDHDPEANKEGQSLLNLLYRVAEEQARKDGYVHRRVTCNSCNVTPIRGIRYSCTNCLDYDLCEQCEAMQIHPKTHLFYKIRIPAPFLGNTRQPEPVWYPGKPSSLNHSLSKDSVAKLCKETGFQNPEVEALWEQFRCLAGAEWPEDPGRYNLAIDRRTFDKCFVPNTSIRPPPPNLIYDRIFSFYDQNNDGLIGFQEFITAVASLTRKKPDERSKRIFNGYDINNDGFVDRKDFLRMFRAWYATIKELTRDIVARMDEDEDPNNGARDVVLGNRPISSAFTGDIPRGSQDPINGKVRDNYGNYRVFDDKGTVNVEDDDVAEADETIGDAAEAAEFGRVRPRNMIGNVDPSFLFKGPWPYEFVIGADIEKTLGVTIPAKEVTNPMDQLRIRQAAHARIAQDHQKRQFSRRKAIRDRRLRKNFYPDSETSKMQSDVSDIVYVERGPVSQLDVDMDKNFRRLSDSWCYDNFRESLIDRIEDLAWPAKVPPTEMTDQICQMLTYGWTRWAIQADFSLHASAPSESSKLVAIIDEELENALKELEPDAEPGEPSHSLPSPHRSRSSSKVRFQDDVEADEEHESRSVTSMSSRSIPVNERWGGFEIPEPEKDVGREILYQVTQEAFNELLDPVFRLREDLALAIQRTASVREKCRPLIIATIKDPLAIKIQLDMYQRRWRRENFGNMNLSASGHQLDEAENYYDFLARLRNVRLRAKKGLMTPDGAMLEKCPRCAEKGEANFAMLGEYCPGQCGYLSKGRKDEITEVERCSRCAESGKEEYIGGKSGFVSCVTCGMPSTAVMKERAKLWSVISHGAPYPANRAAEPLDIEAAHHLHDFYNAFEMPDSAHVERGPPRESLHTLLRLKVISNEDTSSPPDPTLPQNRPNDCLPTASTMSQNRPDNDPDGILVREAREYKRGMSISSVSSDNSVSSNEEGSRRIVYNKYGMKLPKHLRGDLDYDASPDRLIWYAVLDMVEHEDQERGGPGRLNFEEFEEIMKGDKGTSLGSLDSWIEMASF